MSCIKKIRKPSIPTPVDLKFRVQDEGIKKMVRCVKKITKILCLSQSLLDLKISMCLLTKVCAHNWKYHGYGPDALKGLSEIIVAYVLIRIRYTLVLTA